MLKHARQLQWVPYAAIVLLATSACLKIHQLIAQPVATNFIGNSRILTILIVLVELMISLWLLSSIQLNWARRFTILIFGAFFAVSTSKALHGDTSCGCFGELQANPFVTASIDLFLVLAMFAWTPRHTAIAPRECAQVAVLVVLCLLIVALTVTRANKRTMTDSGFINGEYGLVVLDLNRFEDKQFTLARHIQFGERLLRGEWLVVFYHEQCPKCQQIIQEILDNGSPTQVAFVEVPPFESPLRVNTPEVFWTWLDGDYDWYVETPTIVSLKDGMTEVLDYDLWSIAS